MHLQVFDFQDIKQFSQRDRDYTLDTDKFEDFIQYKFDYDAFRELINDRKKHKTDRTLLHSVVKEQYAGIESSIKTSRYLDDLKHENCFTVTTAHQPSLLTGPLYYIYKILSTIRLAEKLNADYKDIKIIPVFVIGGEDHDFEEVNHFNIFGKRLEWSSSQHGAVGRYALDGISEVLEELKEILGDRSQITTLVDGFEDDLRSSTNYAEFSFRVTHRLFDYLGLLIIRMDDPALKTAFAPFIKKEIFTNPSQALIEKSQDKLAELGYDKQAHAREINFFYHSPAGRKRIVHEGATFKVLDTDMTFSEEELSAEIDTNAVAFSPNVVMRPLYQEFILPNLAYIGGGGELAYWMERKAQFSHFGLSMPMLIRRNSALLCESRLLSQISELKLDLSDFFEDEHSIVKKYISLSDQPDYKLTQYQKELEDLFARMDNKINDIDPTLVKTSQSELAKAKKSLDHLEFKLKRTIKQREEVQLRRISKIKEKLFPGGLQERSANILEFMSKYGTGIIDDMHPHMNVFDKDFKVFILD